MRSEIIYVYTCRTIYKNICIIAREPVMKTAQPFVIRVWGWDILFYITFGSEFSIGKSFIFFILSMKITYIFIYLTSYKLLGISLV